MVISEHAMILIEEVSLEVPPNHEKGYLTTVEGLLSKITDDLKSGQSYRKVKFGHIY